MDGSGTPTPRKILTREEAAKLGLPRYFTGIPCGRGHVAERYAKGGSCAECQIITRRLSPKKISDKKCNLCNAPVWAAGLCQNHYAERRRRARGAKPRVYLNLTPEQRIERTRASGRRSAAKHKEKRKTYFSAYQKTNPEKENARSSRWRANNLERAREIGRNFMNAHPEHNAKRRAKSAQAMPAWANKNKIDEMYAARKFAQEFFEQTIHVDHIVPLHSKLVCGLHCEDNLQLLTRSANARKHNSHWPNMWSS